MRLLIRRLRLLYGSCLSGQRFAFGFLPTSPRGDAVAVQLTLPPDGRVEDLHLQVGGPSRAPKNKWLKICRKPIILFFAGATRLEHATTGVSGPRCNHNITKPPEEKNFDL